MVSSTLCLPPSLHNPPQQHCQLPNNKGKGKDADVDLAELGLTPTFNTWAQVSFIHMYLLTIRFRQFPAAHAPAWHQHLLDHFFYDAENRMALYHGMAARGVRNKYLKDLFVQWRGVIAAYDEGLVKGDAVLATAVWRNVFKADENVDAVKLAEIVSYMRRWAGKLDGMNDADVAAGGITFGGAEKGRKDVLEESERLREAF